MDELEYGFQLEECDEDFLDAPMDVDHAVQPFTSNPTPISITILAYGQRRRNYGSGPEAARTSEFRSYDISQSKSYKWLQDGLGYVSKEMLIHFIQTILTACPEASRPPSPSRTQRRVKNGLVQWLDVYEPITFPLMREMVTVK
jgi:hypothetical protein